MTQRFVQGDTRPPLFVALRTRTGDPIDLADLNTSLALKIRFQGSTTIKDIINGTKVAGLLLEDNQTVDTSGIYATPGRGGCVEFRWNGDSLDTPGRYEGEVEITFSDGTIQTVYDVTRFSVRAQF